jgi:ornithine carbamoyltransferase
MQAAEIFGFELNIATPEGYQPSQRFIDNYQSNISYYTDPIDACDGADIVATDVWTSMGKESEKKQRLNAFKGYQVDQKMMSVAKSDALFMHCLPAHRGEEVSTEVIDGKQSAVWVEAENRLHAQKALLLHLIG